MALSTKYDYRFDPFLEAKSYNTISDESKLVPSNTPYYVRLEEVPEQAVPSTITAYDVTAGLTLSEVSTTPASGEFQVDYKYNTSYVRLNAAQAGHTVSFGYQGTGHCIKASDFNAMQTIVETMPESFGAVFGGDESDGDVTISTGTDISGTVKQYGDLTINSGVTLTAQNTVIFVKGTLTINGTISATGGGLAPGTSLNADLQVISPCGGGGGGGDGDGGDGSAGGTSGGAGGAGGSYSAHTNGYDGSAASASKREFGANIASLALLTCRGAGGGAGANGGGGGGYGGGVLLIECETLVFSASGVLSADGAAGDAAPSGGKGAGGGGGGGFILVRAKSIITNAGTIHANGGAGGAASGTMISGAGGTGGAGYAVIVDV